MALRIAETQEERERPNAVTVRTSIGPVLLTKKLRPGGPISGYDKHKNGTSKAYLIDGIDDLFELLGCLKDKVQSAILRGAISPHVDETKPHPRRKYPKGGEPATYMDRPRIWAPLDLDGVPIEGLSVIGGDLEAIAEKVAELLPPPLRNLDFILHLSSSAGIIDPKTPGWRVGDGGKISCHILFLLQEPTGEDRLRHAYKVWPGLDSAVAGAVQPLYTAAPIFCDRQGRVIPDPLPARLYLRKGKRRALPLADLPPPDAVPEKRRSGRGGGGGASPMIKGKSFEELVAMIGGDDHHYDAGKSAVWVASRNPDDDHLWPARWEAIKARLKETNAPEEYASDLLRFREWFIDQRAAASEWAKNIPAPAPDPDFNQGTVDKARKQLEDTMRDVSDRAEAFPAIEGTTAPAVMLQASPGLGKTRAALDQIARRTMPVDFYAKSHDDLIERSEELKAIEIGKVKRGLARWRNRRSLSAMAVAETVDPVPPLDREPPPIIFYDSEFFRYSRPSFTIERGRGAEDPERRLMEVAKSPLMCGRPQVMDAAVAAGERAIRKHICVSCHLRQHCGAFAQAKDIQATREAKGVVFSTHAMTEKQRRHSDGMLAIVDEDVVGTFFERQQGARLADLDHRVAAALQSDRPLVSLMQRFRGRQRALTGLRKLRKDAPTLEPGKVSGQMDDDTIIAAYAEPAENAQKRLVYSALIGALKLGWSHLKHVKVTNGMVSVHKFNPPRIKRETPIAILDATGNRDLLEVVFERPFEVVDITLPERIDLTVINTTGSKAALYDWTDAENMAAMSQNLEAFAKGEPCLVVVHKSVRELWEDRLPDNFTVEHYGALRGSNDYKDCRYAVLIGRQQPPPGELEGMAAALRLARKLPEMPPPDPKLARAKSGYFIHPETGREFHHDPLVEGFRWMACEGELLQAIGRLRSSVGNVRKNVLLVSKVNIPGLQPSRPPVPLMHFRGVAPDAMRNAITYLIKNERGFVATRDNFLNPRWPFHGDLRFRDYDPEAFKVALDLCAVVGWRKRLSAGGRPQKAYIRTDCIADAQAIIEGQTGFPVRLLGEMI